MAQCSYCGRPAGLFRTQHEPCSERHARALALIPDYLSKLLPSSVPAERFGTLINEVAASCFVAPTSLNAVLAERISRFVSTILEERMPDAREAQRAHPITPPINPLPADDAALDLLMP
jgi:hypothetical protein